MPIRRELRAGREAFRNGEWSVAFGAFASADEILPLHGSDLESWAGTAYLLGDQPSYERLLDRAHQSHLDRGDVDRAAYCAVFLGVTLFGLGAVARGNGWIARTRRLLGEVVDETVAHGYLRLADALTAVAAGRFEQALEAGKAAAAIAARFNDMNLSALALQLSGRVHLGRSQLDQGFALLDEAMVAVSSGKMTPQVVGIVYCSVIDGCRAIYSLRRAFEWTEALTQWAQRQPGLVAFNGECRVARAEMLVLHGAWLEALAEADRARERPPPWAATKIETSALYLQAEVMRLRGDFDGATAAYAAVVKAGGQSQPGLALLRLSQLRVDIAHRGLNRALEEEGQPLKRARLLPAKVKVALALAGLEPGGEYGAVKVTGPARAAALDEARAAAEELTASAEQIGTVALKAMASHAEGAVALAAGDAVTATARLRSAADTWRELAAPYETACVQVLLGGACRSLGDEEGAGFEFAAARATFEKLGATPDLERLARLSGGSAATSGLSPRELQVLVRLAAGTTNRAIAVGLDISERTVDRHVSNIFDKLGVTTRTEAASVALRRRLV